MTMAQVCIILLVLAVLLGSGRYLHTFRRSGKSSRPRWWRVFVILLLQITSATLLYFVLFPPPTFTSAERLVILTANANTNTLKNSGRLLALPEAPQFANAEPVPDLASALRRYPGVNNLQIVGAGLTARDQDAARGLSIEFNPSPLPSGLVELSFPDKISSGARWPVQGRIHQIANARVELLDPGNAVVASTQVNAEGKFVLADTARTVGLAMYQLQITDGDKKITESVKLPINIGQGNALKVLNLSGGPNPELKYLRRWAVDAGVELQSQIALSPGMQMNNAVITINSASLREIDLLLLDERAWGMMNRNSKQAVVDALRGGLGLLLRITGPLTATDRNELRALGFAVNDANIVQGVRLQKDGDKKTQTTLTRRPLRVSSSDAVTLLRDDTNKPLAVWRVEGRGRIGLFWLTDTYKLVLNADSSGHGQIWQQAISTLARTRNENPIYLRVRERNTYVNERIVLCNIAAKTYVQEPDADITYLIPDSSIAANKNCAAFWPRVSGWHSVVTDKNELRFYVRDSNDAPGIKANAIHEATMLLATKQSFEKNTSRLPVPGTPWPWFFAWLLVTALLWLLERSKLGVPNKS